MSTKVFPCGGRNCKSEYQDKTYGKGMRVQNKTKGTSGSKKMWRCTACQTENVSGEEL